MVIWLIFHNTISNWTPVELVSHLALPDTTCVNAVRAFLDISTKFDWLLLIFFGYYKEKSYVVVAASSISVVCRAR